ncbi:hypothetical protein V500_03938, partial [Pseudogymnoascus sp. VKM F-4518 (FW-2643)]
MLWLTRPAQLCCVDPRYGLVIGLARTIRSELLLRFSTLELQNLDATSVEAVVAVYQKFQGRSPSSDYEVEPEFAVHDGVVHTGRYNWISVSKELEPLPHDNKPKSLAIGQYGLVDSLHWVQRELATMQAKMDIRCVGMNFRDLLVTIGIVEGQKDTIGIEASG